MPRNGVLASAACEPISIAGSTPGTGSRTVRNRFLAFEFRGSYAGKSLTGLL